MDISQTAALEPLILNELYARLEDVISLPTQGPVELDLGCGTGGFAIAVAKAFPDRSVIAADVMLGRLRKVMRHAKRVDAPNMRILRVEARHLLGVMVPDKFLDRLHILCPDPWPKDKHKANRLLCSEFVTHLHRVLKPSGVFHFASDDVPYVEAVHSFVNGSGLFDTASLDALADVLPFQTDFEKSWIKLGRKVPHFAWRPRKME